MRADGQTDRHDGANSCFSQPWEGAWKLKPMKLHWRLFKFACETFCVYWDCLYILRLYIETVCVYWDCPYILRLSVYIETVCIYWDYIYIVSVYIETVSIYIETVCICWGDCLYILRLSVYIETVCIYWDCLYILRLSIYIFWDCLYILILYILRLYILRLSVYIETVCIHSCSHEPLRGNGGCKQKSTLHPSLSHSRLCKFSDRYCRHLFAVHPSYSARQCFQYRQYML